MKNLKLSKNAKDLYMCLCKTPMIGGNKTPIIQELLDANLIEEITTKKNKGKFRLNSKNLN